MNKKQFFTYYFTLLLGTLLSMHCDAMISSHALSSDTTNLQKNNKRKVPHQAQEPNKKRKASHQNQQLEQKNQEDADMHLPNFGNSFWNTLTPENHSAIQTLKTELVENRKNGTNETALNGIALFVFIKAASFIKASNNSNTSVFTTNLFKSFFTQITPIMKSIFDLDDQETFTLKTIFETLIVIITQPTPNIALVDDLKQTPDERPDICNYPGSTHSDSSSFSILTSKSDSLENILNTENIQPSPLNSTPEIFRTSLINQMDEKNIGAVSSTDTDVTNFPSLEIPKIPEFLVPSTYQCNFCPKSFKTSSKLKTHKRTHTGERPHQCGDCNKAFKERSALKKHKRTHTGKKSFICEHCGKAFNRKDSLKRHKLTHTGEKSFICDVCKKTFPRSDDLKNHKRTHTGEKSFICEHCNKSFTRNSTLKTHKRTHIDERPYQCDVCKKTFPRSGDLKRHKLIHTDAKSFTCKHCKKDFNRKDVLKAHEYTHTDEKPHQCDVCNKRFNQKSNLNTHKRTCHSTQKKKRKVANADTNVDATNFSLPEIPELFSVPQTPLSAPLTPLTPLADINSSQINLDSFAQPSTPGIPCRSK